MHTPDHNDAERAINETKWTVNDYADRAKDYINEKRNNDEEAQQEDWMDRVKNNFSDAWDDVKDKANDAWEKTKDAAEDVKAEWNKKTN